MKPSLFYYWLHYFLLLGLSSAVRTGQGEEHLIFAQEQPVLSLKKITHPFPNFLLKNLIIFTHIYFPNNLKSCHPRVLNWAIQEHTHPVEQAQYRIFPYWASSTGHVFLRNAQLMTLAFQLWKFTTGSATEVIPHELYKYKNPSNTVNNYQTQCSWGCSINSFVTDWLI